MRTGDGKGELVWMVCKQAFEEGALADARGPRADKRACKVGEHGMGDES